MLNGAAVHISMIAFEPAQPTHSLSSRSEAEGSASPSPANNHPGAPSQSASSIEMGSAELFLLDGEPVPFINPDLTTGSNFASSAPLAENGRLSFIGDQKGGNFDLNAEEARSLLAQPLNPNGRPNSDVVRPWVNGSELTGRSNDLYIIDFGSDMREEEAALYEAPFECIRKWVYPSRKNDRRKVRREKWWLHHEPMPALRKAIFPSRGS